MIHPDYKLPPAVLTTVVAPPLRDQFAMAALAGIVSDENGTSIPRLIAMAAYDIADAMMEARQK